MDNTEEFAAIELSQQEDNTPQESAPVEVEKPTSIRDSLEQNLKATPDQLKAKVAIATDELQPDTTQEQAPQPAPIAPPSDMNKAEREAFMNPSPQNAHILQGYLSRRGYEIRTELARQSQVNQDRLSIADEVYQTFEPYAADYQDIRPTEILSNAIAWDQKFNSDPIEAAWEFLDSYGIHPEELLGYQYQPQHQVPEYLTREEAEQLAEEKINALMVKKEQETLVSQRYDALDSFKKSKPLFRDTGTAEQLEAAMAPLVKAEIDANPQRNVQEILGTVYDYVTTTNPVFSELVNRLNAKPMIDKKTTATQKAKAASRSITGSPGSGSPKIHTSLRENLRLRMNGAL